MHVGGRLGGGGGVITIHHKGCFLISHTLISFCLQIAFPSSLLCACVCLALSAHINTNANTVLMQKGGKKNKTLTCCRLSPRYAPRWGPGGSSQLLLWEP